MGQEYGHAYEDLLELALLQILPRLSQGNTHYRISPIRRLKGVTGDIDHLIEICRDGQNWQPFTLFMEKHSDSPDNSHFHFRRHLEEYVQAKVASIRNFGFFEQEPLPVINLIYGKNGGWKETVIQESKRLLHPTLYLVDEPYYKQLNDLVESSVFQSPKPYRRETVKNYLRVFVKSAQSFQLFVNRIQELIMLEQKLATQSHRLWITNEINRALEQSDDISVISNFAYVRRTLTELFILNPIPRSIVVDGLKNEQKLNLNSDNSLSSEDFRAFQLAFVGSEVRKTLNAYHFHPSSIMNSLPVGSWLNTQLPLIEQMFFSEQNPYQMASSDYLAYFDIRDISFINIAESACHSTLALLQGNDDRLVQFLMQPCNLCKTAALFPNRVQDRIQNLYLESVMALASYTAKSINKTRTDLSTSTLARRASISESTVNKARSGTIKNASVAGNITKGVLDFYSSLGLEKLLKVVEIIRNEINLFAHWKSWTIQEANPQIPGMLNPSEVMSLSWFRHNQLNGHSIYNPLSAIILEWARSNLPSDYQIYGFPKKRSANPLQIVLGNKYEGADYEFSIIFWNSQQRKLEIFESSSVINFKHTSDKCKELCAKIRVVRAILSLHCDTRFWLLIDGDWRGEHRRDLLVAGWDEVVYIRDFVEKILNKS
jgi:hypothetical protein